VTGRRWRTWRLGRPNQASRALAKRYWGSNFLIETFASAALRLYGETVRDDDRSHTLEKLIVPIERDTCAAFDLSISPSLLRHFGGI
jgi:hypothetical protein